MPHVQYRDQLEPVMSKSNKSHQKRRVGWADTRNTKQQRRVLEQKEAKRELETAK